MNGHQRMVVRKLSPFGELPAFVACRKWGARCLYGARVIVEYCDNRVHGDCWRKTVQQKDRLSPAGPVDRAVARRWTVPKSTVLHENFDHSVHCDARVTTRTK